MQNRLNQLQAPSREFCLSSVHRSYPTARRAPLVRVSMREVLERAIAKAMETRNARIRHARQLMISSGIMGCTAALAFLAYAVGVLISPRGILVMALLVASTFNVIRLLGILEDSRD